MGSDTRCKSPSGWTLYQCTHGSRVWLPKRCRHCAGCAQARRNKTIAKIIGGTASASHVAMLTLTSTPETDWKTIMAAWSRMARYLRKRSPFMTYAALKEEGTLNGMKHLHVIMVNFAYTPQTALSQEWRRLVGAHIVDIRRVDGSRAATYVAKYVAKSFADVRKSATYGRGWPKLPPLPRTAQALDSCGPWGPLKFSGVTADSGLVALLAPECSCWGDISPPTEGVHWWLKSLMARSSRPSLANSVP